MEILDINSYTPMIRQYLEIKKDYTDSIVFFRLGDFYEMFFDDAINASRVLEIALTGKDAGVKERVPMCGIPYHAYQTYAAKLLENGYKVVIVEQIEDPQMATGIVKRGVVKILTPGTVDAEFLHSTANNFIAAISYLNKMFIVAYADISTGECYLTLANNKENLLLTLNNIKVKEVILAKEYNIGLYNFLNDNHFIISFCDKDNIPSHLNHITQSINEIYKSTLALLFNYAIDTQKSELKHLKPVVFYEDKDYLKLDSFTIANLELTETLRGRSKEGSLLHIIDKTKTAAGSRMLKKWLLRPLVDIDKIKARQSHIYAFTDDFILREELKQSLQGVYDLERIIGKLSCGSINAKDLVQIRTTLSRVPNIKKLLENNENELNKKLAKDIDCHEALYSLLYKSLNDNPPLGVHEGGMIKLGYNSELDNLINIREHSNDWLKKYEQEQKEKLNIKTLKVGFNKVFGYFIEISKGQSFSLGDIDGYERKQTLVNSERYITKELKEFEETILTAKDKIERIEYNLFLEIKSDVMTYIPSLQFLANILANIDCYLSLAEVASLYNYVIPEFTDKEIRIVNGRHPVLEDILKEKYVSNDVYINDYDLLLITGPNMGGKSTYMRMVAIIVILAQIGSFVPATSCLIKIFDQIFTRIGASDDLASGESTFMVEMKEANYALTNATNNSLILFDEIGRGTSTYDGMALAQAIIEFIHQKVKAVTLFSTHYHELTSLEGKLKRLKNIHVDASETKDGVVFLHKVIDGSASKSYGINVALLAGMPKPLIKRAKEILDNLETQNKIEAASPTLFDFNEEKEEEVINPVIKKLQELNPDDLSPKEALIYLYELKKEV